MIRTQTFQRHALTEAAAGIWMAGLTPHELRHITYGLAIASNAEIKVVQTMLDHEPAMRTWDLYGHLYGDRLDEVAHVTDLAWTVAREARGLAVPTCY